MGATLFISDLHLSDNTPEIEAGLYAFLERESDMTRLFILGDFFEYWVGDDDDTPLSRRVIQQLRAVSDRGVSLFLVRGNRDLILGPDFARQIGATLLSDTTVIDLDGVPTLVLHGDTLCTDDVDKCLDPLRHKLGVLNKIGCRIDHTGNQYLVVWYFGLPIPEHSPFMGMARI